MNLRAKIRNTIKLILKESDLSNILLFRGGLPLDKTKLKADGVSFTTSIKVAQYWASSNLNGKVFEYELSPSANILQDINFPENIRPRDTPPTHQDKERIVNYALVKGYDGVNLSSTFNESEIRIFNLDIVKLKNLNF